MRKTTAVLASLLTLSLAGNVYFWDWGKSAQLNAWVYSSVVSDIWEKEARTKAEKDFAAGTPFWYQDLGTPAEVPKDKMGRRLITYDVEFVP